MWLNPTMLSTKDFEETPWLLLAIEAVLIVLSVLLALALHGWYDARKHQRLADRALATVYEEALENCAAIGRVQPYYAAVIAGDEPPHGLQGGPLRNESWEFFVAADAVQHLDYAVARVITAIQANQRFHQDIRSAYTGALFERALDDPTLFDEGRHPPGERFVITELAARNDRLLALYHELVGLVGGRHRNLRDDADRCLAITPAK
jgi:hypothetical protein